MSSFIMQDFSNKSAGANKSEALSPKSRKVRLYAVGALSLLWVGGLVTRLLSLQVTDVDKWQEWAMRQHFAEITVASERGPILDRDHKLVAISVPAESIYVRPGQVKDKDLTSHELAAALSLDVKAVRAKLEESKPFVWIQRQVARTISQDLMAKNLPGVGSLFEPKRMYPFNSAASSLIGKVGTDGKGLSGIEGLYESQLHGSEISTRASKDAFGHLIQISDRGRDLELPKGKPVTLTIDTALQLIVDEELEAGRKDAEAKAALAIMVDSETGEILAMSQSPSVDFNTTQVNTRDALRNIAVETVFEPGSIMKPLVAAAAIEERAVSPSELIDCENGKYLFAKHTIKDVHPSGTIPFFDVVVRSSNIGMTKVGVKLGAEKLYRYLRAFGFGAPTGLSLPGESGGILRPVNSWAMVDVATHSFGQGVAVTPLQMVRAMAVIANGGRLPQLKVVQDGEIEPPVRIVSEKTAGIVREMLYGVVEDEHGTGGKAGIEFVLQERQGQLKKRELTEGDMHRERMLHRSSDLQRRKS